MDSGSTHSLVNKDTLNYFKVDYQPFQFSCNSASGDTINIIGKVNLKLQLTGLSPSLCTTGSFLVNTNCRIPLLIGADFMKANQIKLDLGQSLILCGEFKYGFDPFALVDALSSTHQSRITNLQMKYNNLFIDKIGKANHTFKLIFKKQPPTFRHPTYRIPVNSQVPEDDTVVTGKIMREDLMASLLRRFQ